MLTRHRFVIIPSRLECPTGLEYNAELNAALQAVNVRSRDCELRRPPCCRHPAGSPHSGRKARHVKAPPEDFDWVTWDKCRDAENAEFSRGETEHWIFSPRCERCASALIQCSRV